MGKIVFKNCTLFDSLTGRLEEGREVVVEEGRISAAGPGPLAETSGPGDSPCLVVDVGGRTLMPGLIDAHVHVYSPFIDDRQCADLPPTLMAIYATHRLKAMLDRGFTTARDVAGGDFGIKLAVERNLIPGPRLFISGQAMSTTGGHGDHRKLTDPVEPLFYPPANGVSMLTRMVDGADEMLRAVRDELRKGADQIKLLVSGGVGSPYDPLESVQFSEAEIRAAVEEAAAWDRYVCVHSYTSRSTQHAVRCGVRCIEHGNLIDRETAALMAKHDVYMVPTLVCYAETARRGPDLGVSEVVMDKLRQVNEAGIEMLGICRQGGVKMGFGTDLMGELLDAQSREFAIRAAVLPANEVLQAATAVNAEILNKKGELGVIAPGALADMIVVDGNPLEDISLLQDNGAHLPVIMKGGVFHKNLLS